MKTISIRNTNTASIMVVTETGGIITVTGPDIEGDDDYHTFGELYNHRLELLLALWRSFSMWDRYDPPECWRSKLHHDGTMFDGGWFIVGMSADTRQEVDGDVQWIPKTITYHFELKHWDRFSQIEDAYGQPFVKTLDRAPEWDGHTSQDVLKILAEYWQS